MKILGRKKVNCKLCSTSIAKKDQHILRVKAADGECALVTCPECARTMEQMIEGKNIEPIQ